MKAKKDLSATPLIDALIDPNFSIDIINEFIPFDGVTGIFVEIPFSFLFHVVAKKLTISNKVVVRCCYGSIYLT